MIQKMPQKLWQLLLFIINVVKKCTVDQISAYAAQTAFFILMSVFPFAIFLLQMMRFAPIGQEDLLAAIDSIFPEYLLPTLHEILQEIYSSATSLVTVTVITTLWASSNAMHALTQGLDRICNSEAWRSWIVIRLWSLVYTFAMAVTLVIAVASTVFWQTARSFLIHYRPRGVSLSTYSSVIRGAYAIILLTLVFTIVYRVFPRKKLRFLAQIPGAFVAALGWYLSSIGISIYVTNFNAVSMYGSLTTLALVMFWLYFCSYSIFIGAEINEVLRSYGDYSPSS
ncbi:MAG: YihY/virulence factor BrkB family protein [Lachnospiraceae bacterium]|nr:YihY/virulence factor BrkB family protein [Lachnospiraceae bacterium]